MTRDEIVAVADRVKGYMFRPELAWLADTAASLAPGAAWCELGAWQGRSATAVGLALPPNSLLQLVDNFTGPTTREVGGKANVQRQLQQSIAQLQQLAPTLQVQLATGFSAVVAESFPDGSFDAVFIDGDHAYGAVVADICAYVPKLKPQGLLCGHDFTNKCGVEPAVLEHCPGFGQVAGTSLWYWRRPY